MCQVSATAATKVNCRRPLPNREGVVLALAESGHGVAIIPTQLQCHRYRLRIVGLTYRGRPLREPLTISWEKRRPLPGFATDY